MQSLFITLVLSFALSIYSGCTKWYNVHIFPCFRKYSVTTLRYWASVAHTKHTLLSLLHSYPLLSPPPSAYHHYWGLCHTHVFQSIHPLWLSSFPSSVRMPRSAIYHLLIYHLFAALTFLHFCILLPFPSVSLVLCSPLSPTLQTSASYFVQSLLVIAALHVASTITQTSPLEL